MSAITTLHRVITQKPLRKPAISDCSFVDVVSLGFGENGRTCTLEMKPILDYYVVFRTYKERFKLIACSYVEVVMRVSLTGYNASEKISVKSVLCHQV